MDKEEEIVEIKEWINKLEKKIALNDTLFA